MRPETLAIHPGLDPAPTPANPAPPLSTDEPRVPGQPRHIPEFDGIRGLACFAVILCHIGIELRTYETGLLHILMEIFALGFLGVDVFFALSGYLITTILLGKQDEPRYYKNFYARRLLRLLPPYLLTLLLVALFLPGNGTSLLLSLVYLANFAFFLHLTPGYFILWSLSVEEQFYLVWPWLLRRLQSRYLLLIAVLLCTLTPLARIAAALRGTLDPFVSWNHFDGLAWGALLALTLHHRWLQAAALRRTVRAIASVGILLLFAGVFLWKFGDKHMAAALLYSGAPMVTTALIARVLGGPRPYLGFLRSRPLRFAGDISYWTYLIHDLFLQKLLLFAPHARHLPQKGPVFLVWILASVLLLCGVSGYVVRRFVELPALRLKRYFA